MSKFLGSLSKKQKWGLSITIGIIVTGVATTTIIMTTGNKSSSTDYKTLFETYLENIKASQTLEEAKLEAHNMYRNKKNISLDTQQIKSADAIGEYVFEKQDTKNFYVTYGKHEDQDAVLITVEDKNSISPQSKQAQIYNHIDTRGIMQIYSRNIFAQSSSKVSQWIEDELKKIQFGITLLLDEESVVIANVYEYDSNTVKDSQEAPDIPFKSPAFEIKKAITKIVNSNSFNDIIDNTKKASEITKKDAYNSFVNYTKISSSAQILLKEDHFTLSIFGQTGLKINIKYKEYSKEIIIDGFQNKNYVDPQLTMNTVKGLFDAYKPVLKTEKINPLVSNTQTSFLELHALGLIDIPLFQISKIEVTYKVTASNATTATIQATIKSLEDPSLSALTSNFEISGFVSQQDLDVKTYITDIAVINAIRTSNNITSAIKVDVFALSSNLIKVSGYDLNLEITTYNKYEGTITVKWTIAAGNNSTTKNHSGFVVVNGFFKEPTPEEIAKNISTELDTWIAASSNETPPTIALLGKTQIDPTTVQDNDSSVIDSIEKHVIHAGTIKPSLIIKSVDAINGTITTTITYEVNADNKVVREIIFSGYQTPISLAADQKIATDKNSFITTLGLSETNTEIIINNSPIFNNEWKLNVSEADLNSLDGHNNIAPLTTDVTRSYNLTYTDKIATVIVTFKSPGGLNDSFTYTINGFKSNRMIAYEKITNDDITKKIKDTASFDTTTSPTNYANANIAGTMTIVITQDNLGFTYSINLNTSSPDKINGTLDLKFKTTVDQTDDKTGTFLLTGFSATASDTDKILSIQTALNNITNSQVKLLDKETINPTDVVNSGTIPDYLISAINAVIINTYGEDPILSSLQANTVDGSIKATVTYTFGAETAIKDITFTGFLKTP